MLADYISFGLFVNIINQKIFFFTRQQIITCLKNCLSIWQMQNIQRVTTAKIIASENNSKSASDKIYLILKKLNINKQSHQIAMRFCQWVKCIQLILSLVSCILNLIYSTRANKNQLIYSFFVTYHSIGALLHFCHFVTKTIDPFCKQLTRFLFSIVLSIHFLYEVFSEEKQHQFLIMTISIVHLILAVIKFVQATSAFFCEQEIDYIAHKIKDHNQSRIYKKRNDAQKQKEKAYNKNKQ